MPASIDLVLLHGSRHGAWCWAPLIDAIRRLDPAVGRILALDLPGCGQKRGQASPEASWSSLATALNAEVRQAGLVRPVLLGHSMAGALMPQMSLQAPGLYRELVLLAATVPQEGHSVRDTMGWGLQGADPTRVGFPLDPVTTPAEELMRAMFAQDMAPEQLEWLLAECLQDQWPAATISEPVYRPGFAGSIPVSYIATLRDAILPAHWQGRFAERVGASRLYALDTPHEPFITHPQLLAKILVQQLLHDSSAP